MPKYIANSRITHGVTDEGGKRTEYRIEAGQQFDPSAIGMRDDAVAGFVKRKVIREQKKDTDAPEVEAVEVQSASRTDRAARSIAQALTQQNSARNVGTSRTGAAAAAVGSGSTQGGEPPKK